MKALFFLLLTAVTILSCSEKTETEFKDVRDGKIYQIVTIGQQTMMAENFAYKPDSGNFWAYDNNPDNVKKYGYLYDWETAKSIAPTGWHLPTAEEWNTLYKFLGNEEEAVFNAVVKGGTSGFKALMAGARKATGEFEDLEGCAYFWSSTEYDEKDGWHFFCFDNYRSVSVYNSHKKSGFSVRLFKDKE